MPRPKHRVHKIHHKLIMAAGIGVAVIAFWRGAWGLMDLYLFPNNPDLSFGSSFVIGFAIFFLSKHVVDELM